MVALYGFTGELGSMGPPSTHGEEADECTGPLRDLCFESSGLQPGAWRGLCSTGCVGRATGNQPSSHRLPGPVPVQSATFVGKEELDEFREPWIWWRERDD